MHVHILIKFGIRNYLYYKTFTSVFQVKNVINYIILYACKFYRIWNEKFFKLFIKN